MNWSTIASLATAAGTLVLAIATFASVRSARRGARATERALLAGIRPVIVPSRFEDPMEKIGYSDDKWLKVAGGTGAAESSEEAIYLAIALRNVGSGLAVLDAWDILVDPDIATMPDHRDPKDFRRLTRDIYVPGGSLGFWQGTIREVDDPQFAEVSKGIANRVRLMVDILYGDHEGGQRMITRIALLPRDDGVWLASAGRHWNLDRADPR